MEASHNEIGIDCGGITRLHVGRFLLFSEYKDQWLRTAVVKNEGDHYENRSDRRYWTCRAQNSSASFVSTGMKLQRQRPTLGSTLSPAMKMTTRLTKVRAKTIQ